MQQMLSIKFPEKEIKSMVQQQADHYFEELTAGKTWTMDEFRKNCCGNKSPDWVRLFIFSSFQDEIDYRKSNGWLKFSKGRGSQFIIFAKPACEWMENNRDRIEWEAKMP